MLDHLPTLIIVALIVVLSGIVIWANHTKNKIELPPPSIPTDPVETDDPIK